MALLYFILLVLAFQTYPLLLNNSFNKDGITLAGVSVFMQVLMLWLGILTGNSIHYLSWENKSIIIFTGLTLVGLRMMMDSFKIRKGERSFAVNDTKSAFLASLALSINTYLSGIAISYFKPELYLVLIIIGAASLLFSIIASTSKYSRTQLAFSSFFYLFGGGLIIVLAIFIAFFN